MTLYPFLLSVIPQQMALQHHAYLCYIRQLFFWNIILFLFLAIDIKFTASSFLSVWIFHPDYQLLATECLFHSHFFPVTWDCRCNPQTIYVWTDTADTLYTSYHTGGSSTSQPVYMGTPMEWTLIALCVLAVYIWLQFTDFCLVILRRR